MQVPLVFDLMVRHPSTELFLQQSAEIVYSAAHLFVVAGGDQWENHAKLWKAMDDRFGVCGREIDCDSPREFEKRFVLLTLTLSSYLSAFPGQVFAMTTGF